MARFIGSQSPFVRQCMYISFRDGWLDLVVLAAGPSVDRSWLPMDMHHACIAMYISASYVAS
jgi:hypothetical protein